MVLELANLFFNLFGGGLIDSSAGGSEIKYKSNRKPFQISKTKKKSKNTHIPEVFLVWEAVVLVFFCTDCEEKAENTAEDGKESIPNDVRMYRIKELFILAIQIFTT